jgi:hypothetical protein
MIGKIYKISGKGKSYVGSTTKNLKKRLYHHFLCSLDITGRYNSILYKFIRENGTEHFIIELVEEYNCETIKELRTREQHWIGELKPELNMVRAIRTEEESKLYYQEWAKNHKEELKQYNCEYRQSNYTHLRELNFKNKQEKKEQLKAQQSQSYTCECGVSGWWGNKKRHERTQFHLNFKQNI